MKFLFMILSVLSLEALAYVHCDCEVVVFSPLSGSHQIPPTKVERYTLERFDSQSHRSQRLCRKSCAEEFRKEMSSERLKALLVTYSQELIREKTIGFNCTGLTTLKYPVRVKARLGEMSLGNVEDLLPVVNHEEICFF